MARQRYVTEMGMGVDVHGRDYTNAARRAVSDAIRHSSLNFFTVFDTIGAGFWVAMNLENRENNDVLRGRHRRPARLDAHGG